MSDNEHFLDDVKHVVSMKLNHADKIAARSIAARLCVRESDLYRFAVYHLLNRLRKLHDNSYTGSDLLPLFLEFSSDLNIHLNLKKHQLFKILNGKNTSPDKFVSMADIELLLLPHHAVRQRLQQTRDAAPQRQHDTNAWLKSYLAEKYRLTLDLDYSPDED